MGELMTAETAPDIEVLEAGRYRVGRWPDGTIAIVRTLDSGEQLPPVEIHADIARIIGKILAGEQPDMGDLMGVLAGMPKGALFPAFMGRMINGRGNGNAAGGTAGEGEPGPETGGRAARRRRAAHAVGPSDQTAVRAGSSAGPADPGSDGP